MRKIIIIIITCTCNGSPWFSWYTAKVWHAAAFSCNGLCEASALMRISSTCIYIRMSVRNFIYSKNLERSCGQYSVTNCRCDVSAFDLRKSMCRLSKIDVATFEDRCIALRRSTIDVTMCRPSKIDVSTFGDRCVDLRRSMIDVSTFEDR